MIKTVVDEQEQRDYWLRSFNGLKRTTNNYGIVGLYTLTKDLKSFKRVYINKCKTYKSKRFDRRDNPVCIMADEYIEKNNINIYGYEK